MTNKNILKGLQDKMTKVDRQLLRSRYGKGKENVEGLGHQIELGMKVQPNLLDNTSHKLL
jgi:hypothetical protein